MAKKILIIEDEDQIRKDLVKTLSLCNYETYGAGNGIAGLKMAKEIHPDLIISDIMMPELDGFELLKELQSAPETATIPFLFLSAKSQKNDIREGMNLGADDFIPKPYDIDELLEAVEARLRKTETTKVHYNKKLDELSSSINRSLPHEIRTPLSLILGYSDYLIKKFNSTSPKEAVEMLGNINEAGQRLNRMFENYLLYINIETIASQPKELSRVLLKRTQFAELLIKDTVLYQAENSGRRDDIIFNLEDAVLKIGEEYFTKIINEIIDNCIKFSPPDSKILIESRIDGESYVLSFTDHGRGISREQIDRIGAYIQFDRNRYEQQGSGLGLIIAKKITELHNGEFRIESEVSQHTKVIIKFLIA